MSTTIIRSIIVATTTPTPTPPPPSPPSCLRQPCTPRGMLNAITIFEDLDVDDSPHQPDTPRPPHCIIERWLEGLPPKALSECRANTTITTYAHVRKRRSKAAVDVENVSEPSSREYAHDYAADRRTMSHSPSKRQRPDQDDTFNNADNNPFLDLDATPRSNISHLPFRIPQMPSPTRSTTTPQASSVSAHSSDSRSSRSSGSRSRSPVKLGDLELSVRLPVRRKEFGSASHPVPSTLASVYRDICAINDYGDQVVPKSFHGPGKMDFAVENIRPHLIGEGLEGDWPSDCYYALVQQVRERAAECREYNVSEAEWNCEVHSRLLSLALGESWRKKGIWYRNATSARINDKSLVNVQSKMVDFCITTNPPGQYERVVRRLQDTGLQTINPTMAEYLRFTPIAVSIETKRAGIDEDDATAQLCVWASAHFLLLERLAQPGSPLPPLILITVQGHDWKMMIAEFTPFPRCLVLLQSQPLGHTGSMVGICKIIASLRRFARHVEEDYTPWFQQEILNI